MNIAYIYNILYLSKVCIVEMIAGVRLTGFLPLWVIHTDDAPVLVNL